MGARLRLVVEAGSRWSAPRSILWKLWKPEDGATPHSGKITLNVCFLNGSNADHDTVRKLAPQWTQGRLGNRVVFRFDAPARSSQIRIRFRGRGASVTSLGREALKKTKHEETMHLSVVDQRDILHEFGHALGLSHEHQHPESGIRWNKRVVIGDLKREAGWTAEMCEKQIFEHLSKNCTCIGDPKPDPLSIMLYPIRKSWTLDHKGTRHNTTISERDHQCLEREYRA